MEASMRLTRTTRLAALALLALGVTFNASASEASAKLTGTGGVQTITVNGGTVECEEASVSGTGALAKFTTLALKFTYLGCFFGGGTARVSATEYEFNALGAVKFLSTLTIMGEGSECSIKIVPADNKALETVEYRNKGAKLIETSKLKGITYTSSGGPCGTSGKNGTYTGSAEIEE
jgi:hypothetical protein